MGTLLSKFQGFDIKTGEWRKETLKNHPPESYYVRKTNTINIFSVEIKIHLQFYMVFYSICFPNVITCRCPENIHSNIINDC